MSTSHSANWFEMYLRTILFINALDPPIKKQVTFQEYEKYYDPDGFIPSVKEIRQLEHYSFEGPPAGELSRLSGKLACGGTIDVLLLAA